MQQYQTGIKIHLMDANFKTMWLTPLQLQAFGEALMEVGPDLVNDINYNLTHQIEAMDWLIHDDQTEISLIINTTGPLTIPEAKILLQHLENFISDDTESLTAIVKAITKGALAGRMEDIMQLKPGQHVDKFVKLDEYRGLYLTSPDKVVKLMARYQPKYLPWFQKHFAPVMQ